MTPTSYNLISAARSSCFTYSGNPSSSAVYLAARLCR